MFDKITYVFIVGIKGVAMSGIARILSEMKILVAGSDTDESQITDTMFEGSDVQVFRSFDPTLLPSVADLVIFSAAHGGDSNPQVQEAKRRGIPTMNQAEFLSNLQKEFRTNIAICGCHGKTTTSSITAYLMNKMNLQMSYLVGAPSFADMSGAHYGGKDYFVIEADEYGVNPPVDKTPKFLSLSPDYILATNIDYDHPDVYDSLDATKAVFKRFFKKLEGGTKRIIVCSDDVNLMDVMKEFSPDQYKTYGMGEDAYMQITNIKAEDGHTKFELTCDGQYLGEFETTLSGNKNVLNITGAITLLLELGFSIVQIQKVLPDFTGAKRRLELVGTVGEMILLDDYGHHPEEIRATIQAVKSRYPEHRVLVIFQPHTFSRTAMFKDEFVNALSLADLAFITPIFASARESGGTITQGELVELAERKGHMNIKPFDGFADLASVLQARDVVVMMGAGDIYKLKNGIIGLMERLLGAAK